MDFIFYFLVAVGLPLLISCYDLGSISLRMKQEIKKMNDKPAELLYGNDFESQLASCIVKVGLRDPDVSSCFNDNWKRTGINSPNHYKFGCCIRVVNFKCWKQLLTTKCNMTKEEVERNDDDDYYYFWNNLNVTDLSDCYYLTKEQALRQCNLNDDDYYTTMLSTRITPSYSTTAYWTRTTPTFTTTTQRPTFRPSYTTTTLPSTTTSKLLQMLFGQFQDYQVIVKVIKKNP